MQLVMYLGNEFIASVPINDQELKLPGYLGKLKRRLMAENTLLLQQSTEKAEFLVVHLSVKASSKAGAKPSTKQE
jgi:hypothetical protein